MRYLEYFCTTNAFIEEVMQTVDTDMIKTIYLKGSLTSGEVSETSDIDLCVVWDDGKVQSGTIVSFLHDLYDVVERFTRLYPYFSVPKIMSYRSWRADMAVHFIGFGQESYYTGKVIFGENILSSLDSYQPDNQLFSVMVYRDLLFRMNKTNQGLHYGLIYGTPSFNLKHMYRILKLYLQLSTGKYYSNYKDISNTFATFFSDTAISQVLQQGFNRTVPGENHILRDLCDQVELIFQHARRNVHGRMPDTSRSIEIVGTAYHTIPAYQKFFADEWQEAEQINGRKKWGNTFIGSRQFVEELFRYFDPVSQIIEEAEEGAKFCTVNGTALQLSLQSKLSYLAYNWVNKLFEYRLGRAEYECNYLYDSLRWTLLGEEGCLYCLENKDLLRLAPDEFVAPSASGTMLDFDDLILCHYQMELKQHAGLRDTKAGEAECCILT